MCGKGRKRSKERYSKRHLDQFPPERRITAWEIAVLERARNSALYKYAQRRFQDDRNKDDVFWQKLGAQESSEINKRRQNRNKKSPTRLERWEQKDEERRERAIKFGLVVDDDSLRNEDRMRRRAERFGLKRDDSGRLVSEKPPEEEEETFVGTVAMLKREKSLVEYAETLEKLEKRRARFAQEPRHDKEYEDKWKSEIAAKSSVDVQNEERMLARRRRFAEHLEDPISAEQESRIGGIDRRKMVRRPGPPRKKRQKKDRARGGRNDGDRERAEPVEQQWELEGEQWPTGDQDSVQSSQIWGQDHKILPTIDHDAASNMQPETPDGRQLWEIQGESWSTVHEPTANERSPPRSVAVRSIQNLHISESDCDRKQSRLDIEQEAHDSLGNKTERRDEVREGCAKRYTQEWDELTGEGSDVGRDAQGSHEDGTGGRMRDKQKCEDEGEEWPQMQGSEDDADAERENLAECGEGVTLRTRRRRRELIVASSAREPGYDNRELQSWEERGESW